ncbi:MAG: class I SAM-dependent methyltransferase [Propionibacteriaceae bacterium]|nr:class I SAM-dependent methyltransferase [Propionibacteriaceae bacterium]
MTPAARIASWSYAEQFIPESEAARQARAAAQELGLVPISPGAAQTLTLLARLSRAKVVVEVGAGVGVASFALLRGMDANGTLTSIDSENDRLQVARAIAKRNNLKAQRQRLIAGRPLEVLGKLTDAAYDLVHLDVDPLESGEHIEQALRVLRPGGLLTLYHALLDDRVAQPSNLDDDTLIVRETLEAVRELPGLTSLLLPVGDGLLVTVKDPPADPA